MAPLSCQLLWSWDGTRRNERVAGEGGRAAEARRAAQEYGEWLHQSIRVAALRDLRCTHWLHPAGARLVHCWSGQELKNGYGHRFQASSTFAQTTQSSGSLFVRARPLHAEREQDAAPPRYYCTYYALAHKTNRVRAESAADKSTLYSWRSAANYPFPIFQRSGTVIAQAARMQISHYWVEILSAVQGSGCGARV